MTDLVRTDLAEYAPASNLLFNEHIRDLIQSGKKIYHFAFGQSPFPVVETAVQALRNHAGENAYLPVAGLKQLRQAICDFHQKYDGFDDLDPDGVIVGPGSKELIYLVMHVFNGAGISYSATELQELSNVFRRHNITVLSDEIYSRIRYDQNHVSLAKFYQEGTIISTGLSKWASAGGWRLGYHIYPRELSDLRRAVRSAASHTYTSAPAPVQYAATEMFQNLDLCDEYIKHCSRILETVGSYCYWELTSVGVKAVRPTAGYYIFPDFEVIKENLKRRGIKTCEEMCQLMLDECGVAVMAGGPAFLRPVEELTTRLCYVPFDGGNALAYSRGLGMDKDLPEGFVKDYCTPVYDGIQALKKWVVDQKSY
ncbi:aspartate aminotransferase-like isoform X2 [Crassostrea virginica]